MRAAIIGGTGVYGLSGSHEAQVMQTPYGETEVDIHRRQGTEIVFLARHGKKHSLPPHLVNYRANLWALHELGVKYVYATGAVGSCNELYHPGDVVLFHDFLDFTKDRPGTFYEGEKGVIHTSMVDPYCKNLREIFKEACQAENLRVAGEATYVCTEGPRFETAAEIRMYRALGGDVVGMTNLPEVVLAKELQMCYAAVGIVTNWCTSFGEEIAEEEILAAVKKNKAALTDLFVKIFLIREMTQENCLCKNSLLKL